jgi:hypothetical protein
VLIAALTALKNFDEAVEEAEREQLERLAKLREKPIPDR